MSKKEINVNWDDLDSIKKAERQKSKLENLGYNQRKTVTTGLNKFKLIYEKPTIMSRKTQQAKFRASAKKCKGKKNFRACMKKNLKKKK